jgi:protein-L-isoaspartate(D-aspartate) O-methyltransferase
MDRHLAPLLGLVLATAACAAVPEPPSTEPPHHRQARQRMVRDQLSARDIVDPAVLEVMERVPRHEFVPRALRPRAYDDHALPIAEGQTISQPYVVAFMTQALELQPGDRVLEIGTGSGYQAAVLAELVDHVWSIEIIPALGDSAAALLGRLGYDNLSLHIGDGYRGWPEEAPFDAIIVTAAPDHVPPALVDQLAEGGRLVLPVGDNVQTLIRLRRRGDEIRRETLLPVRFVPMTGEAQQQ